MELTLATETILIVYFLVAINFLFNRLKDFSCHTQTWLHDNLMAKHLFNAAAIFFVIVLFTRSNPIHPAILVVLTVTMYAFFMVIMRCDHRFLAAFMACMVIVFLLEAWKVYKKKQEEKEPAPSPKKGDALLKAQLAIQAISIAIVFIGFFVYVGQKSREYPRWSWRLFWIGVQKCKGNKLAARLQRSVGRDFVDGVKKIL